MSDKPVLSDLVADVLAAGLLFLETYATLGYKSKGASRRRAKIIKGESRAGGSWVRPWTTLDHVESNLVHARSLLVKSLGGPSAGVLTEDEYNLLCTIEDAIQLVREVKS